MSGRQTLEFKPDFADAARRWEAYWEGEILDRPLVLVTAPRDGVHAPDAPTYRDKVFGSIDDVIERNLAIAEATWFGGDAIPFFGPSFGPDEIACFCGGRLEWSDESPDTNWSKPFVERWEDALPLAINPKNPLLGRMLQLVERSAERLEGKMLIGSLDLHTNMDLLAAVRGPERLCMDLIDQPEVIDEAMQSTMDVFRSLWRTIAKAGKMDERGYCNGHYARDGVTTLQCDFCCMISPDMFRRWVMPFLEAEAEIVGRATYHWDGPGALVHEPDLAASRGIHSLSYVPGTGHGTHINYLDLFERLQSRGKGVMFGGTAEECKEAHKRLRSDLTAYWAQVETPAEGEALLDWFVKNT